MYRSTLGMLGAGTENTFLSSTYTWLFFNILALICFALFILLATNLSRKLIVIAGGIVCATTLTLQVLSPIGISTDYYRYIWQGRVSNAGQSNYSLVPWDAGVENANKELFERMDWRDVKSVYPPLAEQYFRIPAALFDSAILKNTSFQIRLDMSRLPSLLLFVLSAFLLYKITSYKLVGFVWLALPFLQFELVNSAHVDVLSIVLVMGALLALKSKNLSAHLLAGALISAAGMVKLAPLLLIIPAACYLLVNFSIKRALASVVGFIAIIALSVQPYINDGFALSKRTIFWLSGGEFSIGNPLYEIANHISSDYGAVFLKALAIFSGVAIIISIIRKVFRKHFNFNEMLKYSLLLTLIPFIASPIAFPWYWITPLVFILAIITSNHQSLKPSNVLVFVLCVVLLLAQYVDRAIIIPPEKRVIFSIAVSLVFYTTFLYLLIKLFKDRTGRLRYE